MRSIEGFYYVVFVIGRFDFITGIIVQIAGGVVLLVDRKRKNP
ncbi:hypothetical protein QVH35_11900 [Candidatus Nitrosotenuis chungbukensis]|nr:hypothetical protein [Candidatus Nitrosotenuis chungbukensis]WKT57961.1 hypothetical protein QVH35_11900 [Candidatus Nitrosotenuis chungbukensis]